MVCVSMVCSVVSELQRIFIIVNDDSSFHVIFTVQLLVWLHIDPKKRILMDATNRRHSITSGCWYPWHVVYLTCDMWCINIILGESTWIKLVVRVCFASCCTWCSKISILFEINSDAFTSSAVYVLSFHCDIKVVVCTVGVHELWLNILISILQWLMHPLPLIWRFGQFQIGRWRSRNTDDAIGSNINSSRIQVVFYSIDLIQILLCLSLERGIWSLILISTPDEFDLTFVYLLWLFHVLGWYLLVLLSHLERCFRFVIAYAAVCIKWSTHIVSILCWILLDPSGAAILIFQ